MSENRITVWVQRFADREHLQLQWHDPATGKRRTKTSGTDDEREAEDARADLEYELNNGLHKEASRMSWERFRELFEQEYVAGTRGETQKNYRDTFNLFERLSKPTSLRAVNERTVSAFVAALRKEPGRQKGSASLMPSTIKVRLQFLHTALQWAADQKLIPACPKFPTVKVPKKRPQPVPAEPFERLLDKAPDANMRAYLLCGWRCGLRLGEAFALEWERNDKAPWVDLAADRIILPAEFVKATEDQWLPLDPELRQALEALPRYGRKVFCFVDRTGRTLGRSGVSQRVRYLARRAGVKLTMRSLRRGFGCRYASKVPAQVLQRLMRHANIKTTVDYYANVDDAVVEAVLGPQRNTSRNNQPSPASSADTSADASL